MPWLTPDSIPEDDTCRPLSIPADSAWLALVSGALTELVQPYNWQQFGALTVQETIDRMQLILESYYAGGCGCVLPGGSRPLRITSDGHLEELGDSGEWGTPTGDYIIPPPEPREGGTPTDQICLASKNAMNVLHQLYESLSDSWNSELDDAEAMTAFTLTAIGLVGFEFAPITAAIVIFFGVVFGVLYHALEYLGADLWDSDVDSQITCFLVDCATNTDGVVTFDYECFMADLNSLTDSFGLTEVQLRLYLQITYILYFIGGIDGLNLAGRTTEITDDECDICPWHYCWLAGDGLGDWETPVTLLGKNAGTYNSGADSIDGTTINPQNNVWSNGLLTETLHMTKIAITYDAVNEGGSGSNESSLNIIKDGTVAQTEPYTGGTFSGAVSDWENSNTFDSIGFVFTAQVSMYVVKIDLWGTGTPPSSGTPCD